MDSEGRIKPTIVSSLKTKHGDQRWAELGEGGRLWQFGGAAVLDVPSTHIMAVALPKVPKVTRYTVPTSTHFEKVHWTGQCCAPAR